LQLNSSNAVIGVLHFGLCSIKGTVTRKFDGGFFVNHKVANNLGTKIEDQRYYW